MEKGSWRSDVAREFGRKSTLPVPVNVEPVLPERQSLSNVSTSIGCRSRTASASLCAFYKCSQHSTKLPAEIRNRIYYFAVRSMIPSTPSAWQSCHSRGSRISLYCRAAAKFTMKPRRYSKSCLYFVSSASKDLSVSLPFCTPDTSLLSRN
jgi:hypothetical protein